MNDCYESMSRTPIRDRPFRQPPIRHSSESWNPEGVGMGKITWRWKKPARHPIFILLCGPLRSMVIPASAGIQGEGWAPPVFIPWGAGASRHERLVRNHVPLSQQGWPAPATPARISCRGESPRAGSSRQPARRNAQSPRTNPNRPLLLGEGWGEGRPAPMTLENLGKPAPPNFIPWCASSNPCGHSGLSHECRILLREPYRFGNL